MNGEAPLAVLKSPLTWLLLVIGLLSIVALNRLLREQPRSYRGVDHALPGFAQRSEEDTKLSGSQPAPAKTRSWRNPVGQSSTRP